ncbi:MAG: hypothetical protein IT371_07945 [Deltaproteobacteria bacterium]|nr:hypothetical protein [Deltaproteobacteria bacterium]
MRSSTLSSRTVLASLLLLSTLAWGRAPRPERSPEATERIFRRVYHFQAQGWQEVRREVEARLRRPATDRPTAVAAVVYLMDHLGLRVGSRRYEEREEAVGVRPNGGAHASGPTFGASSLHKEHVRVEGDVVTLVFTGKAGKPWQKERRDPLLAAALRVFLAQPGERLFQVPGWDATLVPVTEEDVRAFLAPKGALPKDYRTLHANRIYRESLGRQLAEAQAASGALPVIDARMKARAVKAAATFLNHGEGTCRKNYLDPRNLEVATLDAAQLVAEWAAARSNAN